jgi:hypothetical protein
MLRPRRRSTRLLAAATLLSATGCPGLLTPATTLETPRGEMKAILGGSDEFPRFRVGAETTAVAESDLAPDADLLVLRRGDTTRAFLVEEMAWHHVAQGELDGEPFAVVYCVVCDVAIGMTPVVDGRLLHLSAGGLANGVVLARDDETGSYWDVTGAAVAGPLAGRSLPTWPLERTNAAAALREEPDLPLARSNPGAYGTWWSRVVRSVARDPDGYLPPFFRRTLGESDPRREELELGLGVVVDGLARFYPAAELADLGAGVLEDSFVASRVTIEKSGDGATWAAVEADGSRPFQVWGRWYGFAATFSGCDVFHAGEERVGAPIALPSVAIAGSLGD